MRYLVIGLCFFGLTYSAWNGKLLLDLSKSKTHMQYDYAEIQKINYGLFNLQLWKDKAIDIIKGRIHEFTFSNEAYATLDDLVDAYLVRLYDQYFTSGLLINEISINLKKSGKVNDLFLKIIQDNLAEQLKELNLKSRIPGLSKEVVAEIKRNEPQLREYFQEALLKMVMDADSGNFVERRIPIYEKYSKADALTTTVEISSRIDQAELNIKALIKKILAGLAAVIILLIIGYKVLPFREFIVGFILVSIVLLLLGVTLPMIDIDARLNSFKMNVLGEHIEFGEQVLYFQSKSILDVTKTLWEGSGWDLKFVGALIFLFSIVFPFFKLLLSTIFMYATTIRESRFAQAIIFYLGKWSMADVFTVAMFMAYIGFYGLVTSQLGVIGQNQTGYAVETLNYSRLAPGALFFTTYCILSIVTSIMINRHTDRTKSVLQMT